MQKIKTLTLSLVIGLTLVAGVTFAAWAITSWNDTNTWISDGATISAQKVAENFEYLLSLRGSGCTTHNEGRMRFHNNVLEYCNSGAWLPTEVYIWNTGSWGACTETQTRTVECIDEDSVVVSDGLCTTTKPATSQSCTAPTQCSDGIDNNGFGGIDMEDYWCDSPEDDLENISIICTELNRQGLLPDKWLEADAQFGSRMPSVVMSGYHAWAKPVVRAMQGSERITKIVNAIAQPWAKEMAHIQGVEENGSIVGKILMVVGIPLSALIGVVVNVMDWLQSLAPWL